MPAKTSPAFDKAYRQLNPRQKEAVDTTEGPVMVIAGPGTGKTQILATRIANILLKTDTPPYAILALTFTESAAKNMRERLIQLIGPTAYAIHVQTFHAFCEEVIRSYPEYFPVSRESQVLSDLERYEVMESLLRSPNLSALRTMNSPFHYLKAIIKTISDLKREGVTEVKFAELVQAELERFTEEKAELKKTELVKWEKDVAKMQELAVIYTQYQQQLQTLERYDYDDMISYVAEAFAREESLLLSYQERLTYFLVDEYQDTNASQNRVVDLLASFWGEQANIFVVGDPHQSIYRFQGASLENTFNFVTRYPVAKVITLEVGYRCPQSLYDAAFEVIARNAIPEQQLEKIANVKLVADRPLLSVIGDGQKVQVYAAPTAPFETVFIAESLKKLLASGVSPNEVAVLYRNNADSLELRSALEKWEIPYAVDGGNDALQNEEVQQFLLLCKVIADVRTSLEGHELFEVMNYPWFQLDRLLILKIARAAGKTKMSIYDRIAEGYEKFCKLEYCGDVTAMDFAMLEDFITKLTTWGQLEAELPFPVWYERVMNESGFLEWVLRQPPKIILLHHINALFREVKALALQDRTLNLIRFLRAIDTMLTHGLHVAVEAVQLETEAVTLSTVHKAKGQEWAHVFVMQCLDGKWGNTRKPNELPLPAGILLTTQAQGEKDRNEDDRRLFYVALTRAKKTVTISYPESYISGNKPKLALPSIFIEEVAPAQKESVTMPELQAHADEFLARLVQTAAPRNYQAAERNYFQELLSNFKLSVSALNTYLRDPQEFLHQHLLKVPQIKPDYLAFGTAVHFALEQLYGPLAKGKTAPSLASILDLFDASITREILSKDQLAYYLNHGHTVLAEYYEYHRNESIQPLLVEKFFGYGFSKTVFEGIELNGRIDRIDVIDKASGSVRVVDYKTGRARTINEIEGKVSTSDFSERELALPENIRGPYKRQLLFYKLLTQLDRSFRNTVTEGVFDFVEPNDQGKFVQRSFVLLDADVEALKNLIREVITEIRTLRFLETE